MLCDIVVLYCMKKRYYYREKKYKYVEDYELVSISKGKVASSSDSGEILKRGCRKSTSNRDSEPEL